MVMKHTQGRLTLVTQYAQPELRDASGELVAVVADYEVEDARRLAACWNACESVSTEHLEDDAVRKLMQDRDLLLAQRNELLKALQEMVDGDKEAIEEAEALGVPFPEEMLATHRRAVAAIAKAAGGQA